MTNEQLVLLIQEGNKELIPVLWDKNMPFVRKKARGYYEKYKNRCQLSGVEYEDLFNQGYIAFIKAIDYYKKDSEYKFITFINFPLKRAFNEAMGIHNGECHKPLNNSVSLNEKSNEEGETTLEDIIPDNSENYEKVINEVYIEQLHNALEKSISTLPERQGKVIREIYFNNKTLSELADNMGLCKESIRQIKNNGLKGLRKQKSLQYIEEYREDIINMVAYRHIGLTSYNSNMTSQTEKAFIKLYEYEEKIKAEQSDKYFEGKLTNK